MTLILFLPSLQRWLTGVCPSHPTPLLQSLEASVSFTLEELGGRNVTTWATEERAWLRRLKAFLMRC